MKGSEGNTSQKVHLTRSERCDIIDRLSHGKARKSGKINGRNLNEFTIYLLDKSSEV